MVFADHIMAQSRYIPMINTANTTIISDKELRQALHDCCRELAIEYKVDKVIKEMMGKDQWIKDWREKDIKWCISDEEDLLLIFDDVIVMADGALEFRFKDSKTVEYERSKIR